MTDLIMRPLTGPDEVDLFNQLPYMLNGEFADDLDKGRRRLGWTWVALREGRVVGRAGWWAPGRGAATPMMMDVFDVDVDGGEPLETGADLIRTATNATIPDPTRPPDFVTFVDPDWRDRPDVRRVVETRVAGLERTGAKLFVERLRLEWRPGTPIAPPSQRLRFRPVEGRDELVRLMTKVLDGTLDAHSRRDLRGKPPAQVAAEQYDGDYLGDPKPREWWRVATLPSGEPVGFVIPARGVYNAVISYIGVVPEHRGHGYIDDILAEGTRIITDALPGVPRIRSTTDVGNVPMARAFARNGYVISGGQINMTWSSNTNQ